jgi:hypothetical protein
MPSAAPTRARRAPGHGQWVPLATAADLPASPALSSAVPMLDSMPSTPHLSPKTPLALLSRRFYLHVHPNSPSLPRRRLAVLSPRAPASTAPGIPFETYPPFARLRPARCQTAYPPPLAHAHRFSRHTSALSIGTPRPRRPACPGAQSPFGPRVVIGEVARPRLLHCLDSRSTDPRGRDPTMRVCP